MNKLTFLGVGSAFCDSSKWQSNMLLTINNKNLLIDCGGDVRHSLAEIKKSYKDIDAVYISHLHNDHCGGMEYLAFCSYFDPSCEKPKLFINHKLVNKLWNNILSGGLKNLTEKDANLSTYFKVISNNSYFIWQDITFQMIESVHVVGENENMYSYGLKFKINDKKYYITTDIQFSKNIKYDDCDLIFQDSEISKFPSGVHSHMNDLKTLPQEIKNKMWLYHYNGDLPEHKDFLGFVKKGQEFKL